MRISIAVERLGRSIEIVMMFPSHYEAIEFYERCTPAALVAALNGVGMADVEFRERKQG